MVVQFALARPRRLNLLRDRSLCNGMENFHIAASFLLVFFFGRGRLCGGNTFCIAAVAEIFYILTETIF